MGLIEVAPVRTPAPWLGGKRWLAEAISDRLRAMPHRLYAEPFLGMGGVFLRRGWRSQAEVVNDINRDVVNLFRCLQRHFVPLCDMLRWQITSRDEFERLAAANADALTDLERAVRFLYLQRAGFGGRVRNPSFGTSTTGSARFDVTKLVPLLQEVHERLAGVVIERLGWTTFIERYDRLHTLFYLDPPYAGSETAYGAGVFSPADFEALATLLATIRGRFLLSINDTREMRKVFGGFAIEVVETHYSVNPATAKERRRELLISGKK